MSLGLEAPGIDHHSEKMFCVQMDQQSNFFLFFFCKTNGVPCVADGSKKKKDHPDGYQQLVQQTGCGITSVPSVICISMMAASKQERHYAFIATNAMSCSPGLSKYFSTIQRKTIL